MHCYKGICLGVSAFVGLVSVGLAQTYAETVALFNDKLNNGTYSVDVRPLRNQSQVLQVNVSFTLLTIVDIDDVSQSFNCNGFLAFIWKDEMLAWDPDEYGGQTMIHPQAKDIWRPRVILGNTLGDRDIFADDNAPIILTYDGVIRWYPGSTFPTSCALNMIKYPFDKQSCYIQLVAMGYTLDEVEFVPNQEPVDTEYYVSSGEFVLENATINLYNGGANIGGYYLPALVLMAMGYITEEVQFVVAPKPVETKYFLRNGEWALDNAAIVILNVSDDDTHQLPTIVITFSIRRNPIAILVNTILPVVFLSFLNLWVFVIPVESGEKIGYGTTVLMALSVFMTTMSAMLPASSEKLPSVVIYLFILLIISLLTVITSIVIVFLHHKEEKQANHNRAKTNLNRMTGKVMMIKGATTALENAAFHTKNPNKIQPYIPEVEISDQFPGLVKDRKLECRLSSLPNRYRIIGKYIDLVSLIIFFGAWLGITLAFLLDMSST